MLAGQNPTQLQQKPTIPRARYGMRRIVGARRPLIARVERHSPPWPISSITSKSLRFMSRIFPPAGAAGVAGGGGSGASSAPLLLRRGFLAWPTGIPICPAGRETRVLLSRGGPDVSMSHAQRCHTSRCQLLINGEWRRTRTRIFINKRVGPRRACIEWDERRCKHRACLGTRPHLVVFLIELTFLTNLSPQSVKIMSIANRRSVESDGNEEEMA